MDTGCICRLFADAVCDGHETPALCRSREAWGGSDSSETKMKSHACRADSPQFATLDPLGITTGNGSGSNGTTRPGASTTGRWAGCAISPARGAPWRDRSCVRKRRTLGSASTTL